MVDVVCSARRRLTHGFAPDAAAALGVYEPAHVAQRAGTGWAVPPLGRVMCEAGATADAARSPGRRSMGEIVAFPPSRVGLGMGIVQLQRADGAVGHALDVRRDRVLIPQREDLVDVGANVLRQFQNGVEVVLADPLARRVVFSGEMANVPGQQSDVELDLVEGGGSQLDAVAGENAAASDACWCAATYRIEAFAKPQGVQRQFEAIGAGVLVERAVAALMKVFLKAGNRSSAGGVGGGNRHKGLLWEGHETGPGREARRSLSSFE
ncbi:hypothetical protein AAL_08036 [Moelleriella libera RCEF 2490]|uniref:Uncharacterized protein n=1 Tax=Moelleriella libera RCEF 2490 TaxID=1081109 RepID=A0A167W717_9HYPO|nr:hypothetical protein AAL_08036 [Moelleriella libera RCEF 2490]